MNEVDIPNHPDAVCPVRDLPCRELGKVLIERDVLREKLDDCLESLRLIEKATRPDGDMADAAVNLLIRSCRWHAYEAHACAPQGEVRDALRSLAAGREGRR